MKWNLEILLLKEKQHAYKAKVKGLAYFIYSNEVKQWTVTFIGISKHQSKDGHGINEAKVQGVLHMDVK